MMGLRIFLETRNGKLETIYCDSPALMTEVDLRVIEREIPDFTVTVLVVHPEKMDDLLKEKPV